MTWLDDLPARSRRVYSQTGEEGILEAIFEVIGPTNRFLVDIGAGNGKELSNTRLLIESGWHGCLIDAAYAGDIHQERITAENVTDVLAKYNVPGEPDLLSLDIDGIDWWVLRSIFKAGYRPRVLIVEINGNLPADPPVTVMYNSNFVFSNCRYYGASFGAFRDLCRHFDYDCIHIQHSLNAFFVSSEFLKGLINVVHFMTANHWPVDPLARPWHVIMPADYI